MKKSKNFVKNEKRTEFRVKLLMTKEEKNSIIEADNILHERYDLKRNDVLRQFLTNSLSDSRILLLLGFTPKRK